MNQKWVFESLVTDENDGVGLIAYALYKHKKHTLAKSLREQGHAEEYIQQQVKTFHDQTLHNNSLDDYRDKAGTYLNEIFLHLERDIKSKFEKEKLKTEKDCAATLKKERANFIKGIKEYERINKLWYERLWAWLISGIPGIVSSFLLTAFILGASLLIVPEEMRKEAFTSLAAGYLGISDSKPRAN